MTDASTIAVDAAMGNKFEVTLTGNGHGFGVPTNPQHGDMIKINVGQGAGGFAYAFDAIYQFTLDVPFPATTSTAPGAVDMYGFEYNFASNKWWCIGTVVGHS